MSKAKKHLRPCPALGRDITPAECGSGRGSAYRCPADCGFFPFTPANYEKHGEIEERLIRKALFRGAQKMSPAERESQHRAFDAFEDEDSAILRNHAAFAWLFHVRRDAKGISLGERWLAEKTSDLTNDERVLLAGLNQMRPAVFEVHRIIDEQTVEGVDLLTGQPLRIVDVETGAAALRYGVLLTWVYPMAHYDRVSGSSVYVPDVPPLVPEEVVREVIRHLGGPLDAAGERAWLSEHFVRVATALTAVQSARWQDALAAMDARHIKTDYRLRKGEQVLSRLTRRPDVVEETPSSEEFAQGFDSAYVWLSEASAPESEQLDLPLTGPPKIGAAPLVVGRILIGDERVRVEALTGARHQELRARFEELAAGHLEFLGERTDDMAAQTAVGREKYDPSLVPPRLREHPQQMNFATQRVPVAPGGRAPTLLETFSQQYATFADEPVPALDGQTPRAAAGNPALRPRLVALMKTHIRQADRARREEGIDLDLNPLLATLGLQELISEPPPLGLADDEFEEDDIEADADETFEDLAALSLELSPHTTRPPLNEHDIEQRTKDTLKRYPSSDNAADVVDEMFPGLLDLAFTATGGALNDHELMILEVVLMRACHLLGPSIPPGPALDHGGIMRDLAGEFARASEIVLAPKSNSADVERWAKDSPEPVVMQDLIGTLFIMSEKLRRKERPRNESVPLILACAKAVVAELSRTRVR